jgi:hypothetical protein
VKKVFRWGTHEEGTREQAQYWLAQSVEARISAVEAIRTGGHHDPSPPRLERVFELVDAPWGQVPPRRRLRRGSERVSQIHAGSRRLRRRKPANAKLLVNALREFGYPSTPDAWREFVMPSKILLIRSR